MLMGPSFGPNRLRMVLSVKSGEKEKIIADADVTSGNQKSILLLYFIPKPKISSADSYPTPPPSPPRTLASMETTPETQSKSHPHRLPPGREDWWSEDATATLIEAWGDRYVNLSRGNLRQNDWREVADAVNSIHGGGGRPKTDVQCKNRIDTLKKKYKTEKAKPSPSSWCFFERLDFLIGPVAAKKSTGVVTPALKNHTLNQTGSKSSGSSLDDDDDDDDDDEVGDWGFVVRKHRRVEEVDPSGGEGSSCRELARAILKLGEVYERMEGAKQRMMVELEKERMEAAKELELQRMNMLMDMQMELERSKLGKRRAVAASGKKL